VSETKFRRIEGLIPVAAADVISERKRQIEIEKFDTFHDDRHTDGALARAAAAYALNAGYARYNASAGPPSFWPRLWYRSWWKPKDRRRDLVRAAALIIAEIERIDRAAEKPAPKKQTKK
jgi:hypothetical protein